MRGSWTFAGAAASACVTLCVGVALAADVDCAGGGVNCEGTPGPDLITGSSQRDLIFGKGGGDEAYGGPANDVIHGQLGNDNGDLGLNGGNGDDLIYGEDGRDYLSETDSTGRDRMIGGPGDDIQMEGGPEGDFISGGPGDEGDAAKLDTDMFGDQGPDRIYGGRGRDALEGEEGADKMFGGRGNDFIDAANDDAGAVDIVRCGKGKNDVAEVGSEDVVSGCEILDPDT